MNIPTPHRFATTLALGIALSGASASALSADKLVIESWRNDDSKIWNDVIIPAFNQAHPEIELVFSPTPPSDYNSALQAKLQGEPPAT
ncbi:hypothetical protein [Marinobacterium aestuariivivens]|uniref:Sugar ABC transporter substrate-binding protein n=1 Tax=Marinobacterium aestuariivivens TaxID=1698799 RepID=A0ABW2A6R6_9GAMM